MSKDGQPRILITRLSAIGDCVLTMPVACALRRHFPEAYIAWLTQPAAATLLEGHQAIDELIVVEKDWLKSPRGVLRLRRELRTREFNVAIDPQSLTKSSVPAWLSGAKQRIGFASPQGRELSLVLNQTRLPRERDHLVDAQLDLLKPLGIENADVDFQFPYHRAAGQFADRTIRNQSLSDGFAIINPGAGWASRIWPASRFAAVARYIGERWNVPSLVVWAGMKEQHVAESIVAGAGGHAVLAPETSLIELAALTRRAQMFFSADTGPLHIAAALGIPCIGLYGATHAKHSGPYGSQHIVLQGPYRETSKTAQRNGDDSAMRAISSQEAADACDRLLGELARSQAA